MEIPLAPAAEEGRAVLARLDRLPAWPLPWTDLAILGVGCLLTFYNLAWDVLGPVVGGRSGVEVGLAAGLLGYLVGSVAGGALADRAGRVVILAAGMAVVALSALAAALWAGAAPPAGSDLLTGAGAGAVLNLTSTYVVELSPAKGRGRLNGITFLIGIPGLSLGAVGALIAAGHGPGAERWVSLIGCLVAVTGPGLRRLPESPRWLVQRGRVERASAVVERMEGSLRARGLDLAEPGPPVAQEHPASAASFGALRQAPYQQRVYRLAGMWVLWYLGAAGLLRAGPTLFGGAAYGGAARIAFVGAAAVGFPIGAAVMAVVADRFERRILVFGATAAWVAGMGLTASLRGPLLVAAGLLLASAAFGLYLPLAFVYTAESLPTRARASGFGIAEGGGRLGGLVGALALPAIAAATSARFGLVAIGVTGLAGGLLALAGPRTTGRRLEDLSG